MTTFNAEGASFLELVSPPGWYWYLPSPPPSSQGLLFGAWATARSEEALVGDRAVKRERCPISSTLTEVSMDSGALTEVPSRNTEDTAHDSEEDL